MAGVTEVSETAVLAVPVERVWEVISATHRYGEWVVGVLEVTDHHETAQIGRTYAERNVTVGPLRTRSVWTVAEIEPMRRRVDTGTGFDPMHDMTNTFTFLECTLADGSRGTVMTYAVRYRPGLGPVGGLIDRLQRGGLRRNFQASMRRLEDLIVSEG
ncbi:SRPBCC family protein [Pseudonocardia sp. GCM10023141]|uniref:SRPBCC family protein n=1 Tax=Pseudonocardia sp. GCM10023141 TaxID=3252653 RepID=UPI003621F53E